MVSGLFSIHYLVYLIFIFQSIKIKILLLTPLPQASKSNLFKILIQNTNNYKYIFEFKHFSKYTGVAWGIFILILSNAHNNLNSNKRRNTFLYFPTV